MKIVSQLFPLGELSPSKLTQREFRPIRHAGRAATRPSVVVDSTPVSIIGPEKRHGTHDGTLVTLAMGSGGHSMAEEGKYTEDGMAIHRRLYNYVDILGQSFSKHRSEQIKPGIYS